MIRFPSALGLLVVASALSPRPSERVGVEMNPPAANVSVEMIVCSGEVLAMAVPASANAQTDIPSGCVLAVIGTPVACIALGKVTFGAACVLAIAATVDICNDCFSWDGLVSFIWDEWAYQFGFSSHYPDYFDYIDLDACFDRADGQGGGGDGDGGGGSSGGGGDDE